MVVFFIILYHSYKVVLNKSIMKENNVVNCVAFGGTCANKTDMGLIKHD
jgi:hypothetical protein